MVFLFSEDNPQRLGVVGWIQSSRNRQRRPCEEIEKLSLPFDTFGLKLVEILLHVLKFKRGKQCHFCCSGVILSSPRKS